MQGEIDFARLEGMRGSRQRHGFRQDMRLACSVLGRFGLHALAMPILRGFLLSVAFCLCWVACFGSTTRRCAFDRQLRLVRIILSFHPFRLAKGATVSREQTEEEGQRR